MHELLSQQPDALLLTEICSSEDAHEFLLLPALWMQQQGDAVGRQDKDQERVLCLEHQVSGGHEQRHGD